MEGGRGRKVGREGEGGREGGSCEGGIVRPSEKRK